MHLHIFEVIWRYSDVVILSDLPSGSDKSKLCGGAFVIVKHQSFMYGF